MKQALKLYDSAFTALVKQFVYRYYKELYNEEPDELDYDIMWWTDHGLWPININDMYLNIDEIYIAEANNIPCLVVENFYNDRLQAHYEWKELGVNLINYWKRSKMSLEEIEEEHDEDLKRSEESVKKAEQTLEECIKNHEKEISCNGLCMDCWKYVSEEWNWYCDNCLINKK